MTGCVILVGAGPGDPGLLTLKGRAELTRADVVVYDRLVSPEILAMIPKTAKKINVGKQSSHHLVPQEEINRILLTEAQQGKRVVRLKGGDPFLFGRGGEELELLAEHDIPFEVVPGITSALAVPAYGGIPVTHRAFCSSLHIVTGHAKEGAALQIDFDALRKAGGTLVFLMGVTALPKICQGLLNAGMPSDTPAAVVQQGTTPQQRKLVATLATLTQEAQAARISSPAIIVVGQVCSLSDRFDWFDRLPLKGKPIVVTRPADRIGTLSQALRELGADVVEYPCIATVPRTPAAELDEAIRHLEEYRWLVFTSPAGPRCFFDRLIAAGTDVRALRDCKLAAIGPKTASALRPYGLVADLLPTVYDGEHLAAALAEQTEGRVLLCQAAQGNPVLEETLLRSGRAVTRVTCYDTCYRGPADGRVEGLLQAPVAVTFTSASTVTGFVESLPGAEFSQVLGCCIGQQTAAEAERYGIRTVVAKKATMDSLIELILEKV